MGFTIFPTSENISAGVKHYKNASIHTKVPKVGGKHIPLPFQNIKATEKIASNADDARKLQEGWLRNANYIGLITAALVGAAPVALPALAAIDGYAVAKTVYRKRVAFREKKRKERRAIGLPPSVFNRIGLEVEDRNNFLKAGGAVVGAPFALTFKAVQGSVEGSLDMLRGKGLATNIVKFGEDRKSDIEAATKSVPELKLVTNIQEGLQKITNILPGVVTANPTKPKAA